MIEIFNILPKISSVLSKDQDGNAYLKLGNHVAFALFRVSLTFIAIRNSNYLTKANDLLISLPRGRMTTMVFIIYFFKSFSDFVQYLCFFETNDANWETHFLEK